MASFREFMAERRNVDRWFVLKIGLAGGFMGALLAVMFMLLGFA